MLGACMLHVWCVCVCVFDCCLFGSVWYMFVACFWLGFVLCAVWCVLGMWLVFVCCVVVVCWMCVIGWCVSMIVCVCGCVFVEYCALFVHIGCAGDML